MRFIDAIAIMSDWDWERIGLASILLGYSIYGVFEVNRTTKREQHPTHRYNRDTGKVERIDE